MTKKVELFSGKVLKIPHERLSEDRYKWLRLSEAEPDLDVPEIDGSILYSNTLGNRIWSTVLKTDQNGRLFVGPRIQGNISGQDLEIGTLTDPLQNVRITTHLIAEQNLSVNGNTTLGNTTSDTVRFLGRVSTDLLVSQNNAYKLGADGLKWSEMWSEFAAIGNLRISYNTISPANPDGDIILAPDGNGSVSVSNARITDVAIPIASTDAVNKQYVDQVAQGVEIKPAVEATTTGNLAGVYDNGLSGIGATLNIGPAETLAIDGYTGGSEGWHVYDGILIKNQNNAAQNGRYYISQIGDATTDWIFTRCTFCDEPMEIPSTYIFVQYGDTQSKSSWVATVENVATFSVGVDPVTWIQFNAAGSYSAGAGLQLNGTEFSVDLITVPLGGTGVRSLTARGIPFGNGVNSIGVTDGSINDGSFLREDMFGNPYWSNVIDGGEY